MPPFFKKNIKFFNNYLYSDKPGYKKLIHTQILRERHMRVLIFAFIALFVVSCSKDNKKAVEKQTEKVIKEVEKKTEAVVKETEKAVEEVGKDILSKSKLKDLSTADLWKVYKECRTKANDLKDNGKYKESIGELLTGAEAAVLLKREDIASWQYNNAGKHAIDWFKKDSEYADRMRKIESMKPSDEKIEYIKETKNLVRKKMSILKDASGYLKEAKKLDAVKSDSKRKSLIESNEQFIKSIEAFIS